jgi:integrase
MEWAKKNRYVHSHNLDLVDPKLRKRGRRQYIPEDGEVFRAYRATKGKFRDFLNVLMLTGMRPKEIRTVLVEEFDLERRQLVLWRHKTVDKTGLPKAIPLPTDELVAICQASAEGRPGGEPLLLTDRKRPWTYQAIRLRWSRLREKLGIDTRFTLYSFRHWYLTMAVESGEDGAIVSELAGHSDPKTLEVYKKIRNRRLHEASRRVAQTIERAGKPEEGDTPAGAEAGGNNRPGAAGRPAGLMPGHEVLRLNPLRGTFRPMSLEMAPFDGGVERRDRVAGKV